MRAGWSALENVHSGRLARRLIRNAVVGYATVAKLGEQRELPTRTLSRSKKDYRFEGRDRYKTMILAPDEFIRRFLIHVLPKGFHRIRHYGLFANAARTEKRNVGSGSRNELLADFPSLRVEML